MFDAVLRTPIATATPMPVTNRPINSLPIYITSCSVG